MVFSECFHGHLRIIDSDIIWANSKKKYLFLAIISPCFPYLMAYCLEFFHEACTQRYLETYLETCGIADGLEPNSVTNQGLTKL